MKAINIKSIITRFITLIMALVCYSSGAFATMATFQLQDKTGLPSTHKIYVAGFSAQPGYYLNVDGQWTQVNTSSGQIPCFQLGSGPGQISQVTIDSAQPVLSARVYFFIDDKGVYPVCNNGTTAAFSNDINGIFGTPSFSYTLGTNGIDVTGITQATIGSPMKGVPIYSFSELSNGPSGGTIDISQVDLFSFPVTINASVIKAVPPALSNPSAIGNTLGANASDSISFSDNAVYTHYINNYAGTGGCAAHPNAPACAYLDLISPYEHYSALLNPGGFLSSNIGKAPTSKLNTIFDPVINLLWGTNAPTITLNNGGKQNNAPQEDLIGTAISMHYPCGKSNCPKVQALKFVGVTSGYVAYIFSPIGYAAGCAKGVIMGCPAGSIASSGNQVFSGSGVFGSTAASEYTNLVAKKLLPKATTKFGLASYNMQVARLGLIMTQALNHGVFTLPATSYSWKNLNIETNWYPAPLAEVIPNLFAQFIHTASNTHNIPFFIQPPGAVKSAAGLLMGMGYGFSNDEQPTPVVPNTTHPEVPSKMDGTVIYNNSNTNTITLGPWAQSPSPATRYYVIPQISTARGTKILIGGVKLKNLQVYVYNTPTIDVSVNGSPYVIDLVSGLVSGANPSAIIDTISTQSLPHYGSVSVNNIVFPARRPKHQH